MAFNGFSAARRSVSNWISGRLILSLAMLTGTTLMCGCAKTPPAETGPTEPVMATPEKLSDVRDFFNKARAGTLVGQVVVTNNNLAAVLEIPVKEVKIGQTVTFVDADKNVVNNGTVVAIVDDSLHVRFDATGKRPVQKGDYAVIVKE